MAFPTAVVSGVDDTTRMQCSGYQGQTVLCLHRGSL